MGTGQGLSSKLSLSEGGGRRHIKSKARMSYKPDHCNNLAMTSALYSLDPVDH